MGNFTPIVVDSNNKPIPLANGASLVYPDGSPIITAGEPKATHRAKYLSTSNISDLSSPPVTVDGGTLTDGDTVLLIAQSTASENGLYVYDTGELVRHGSMDQDAEINATVHVQIIEGTLHAGELYALSALGGLTIGVSDLDFTRVVAQRQIAVYTQEIFTAADDTSNDIIFAKVPKAGYVTACEILLANARTGGTLTATPKNVTQATTMTSLAAAIDGTNASSDNTYIPYGTDSDAEVAANDVLSVNIAASAGYAPEVNRAVVNITVEYSA